MFIVWGFFFVFFFFFFFDYLDLSFLAIPFFYNNMQGHPVMTLHILLITPMRFSFLALAWFIHYKQVQEKPP